MEKLALTVVIGAAVGAAFKATLGDASKSLSDLGKTVQETKNKLNDLGKLNKLETGLEKTRYDLALARTALESLEKSYEKAKASGKDLPKAFKEMERARSTVEGLEKAVIKDTTAIIDLRTSLDGSKVDFNETGKETEKLTEKLKDQEIAFKRNTETQNRRTESAAKFKAEWAKIGAAIGFAGSTIKNAMAFESVMADVRKVVDFDTPEQFKAMGNDIQRLSTVLPMTAEGIGAIVAAGGQAGIARGELVKFAEDATKMGVAFDTTAEESGQMMAQWRTAFRMSQDDVRGLADQINYLGNTGPANAASISDIVTKIGPLGEVAGLASGQIAALGSTVAGMGIAPEVAATGIKNMMLALSSGASATKAQKTAFSALGLDTKKLAVAMQKDAGGAILDVMTRLQKLPKEAQAASLTKLFGKESVGAIV